MTERDKGYFAGMSYALKIAENVGPFTPKSGPHAAIIAGAMNQGAGVVVAAIGAALITLDETVK